MKQKLSLFLSFMALAGMSFAQKEKTCSDTRMFGIHLTTLDVTTPIVWKENSAPRGLPGLREADLGFTFSYWKSLCCHNLDLSGKATIMFHNYAAVDRKTYSAKHNLVGFEIEPAVNAKLYPSTSMYNAFLTVGAGAGYYSGEFGAYVPTGVGLSACLGGSTTIMLQSQYRFSLTSDVLRDNIIHSVGIIQKMGKEKPEVVVPPAPPVADSDKDGILDNVDKCPTQAGTAKYNGCPVPDTDNDGINDEDDKCPSLAGTFKYQGCPVPDTDGDGINDENDKCPNDKGYARYQGCGIPDTDNDGVNDEEDKCPSVAGLASNSGCPEIEKKVIERINYAAKSIQFATGSAKILPASFKSLDEVVAIMKSDNTLMIDIEGHSDNVGDVEVNKKLSGDRAESVKAYFISKGITADRIQAAGFGSEKPVADNNTAAGRAKNRRTEMKIRNH